MAQSCIFCRVPYDKDAYWGLNWASLCRGTTKSLIRRTHAQGFGGGHAWHSYLGFLSFGTSIRFTLAGALIGSGTAYRQQRLVSVPQPKNSCRMEPAAGPGQQDLNIQKRGMHSNHLPLSNIPSHGSATEKGPCGESSAVRAGLARHEACAKRGETVADGLAQSHFQVYTVCDYKGPPGSFRISGSRSLLAGDFWWLASWST